jgi:protein TonB
MREYRIGLATQLRRFAVYPPSARVAGMAGRTEIRLAVAAGGYAQSASIFRSSGHALLDEAALDMLQRAAAVVAAPPVLRGRDFEVVVPVEFAPED